MKKKLHHTYSCSIQHIRTHTFRLFISLHSSSSIFFLSNFVKLRLSSPTKQPSSSFFIFILLLHFLHHFPKFCEACAFFLSTQKLRVCVKSSSSIRSTKAAEILLLHSIWFPKILQPRNHLFLSIKAACVSCALLLLQEPRVSCVRVFLVLISC